jgi:hypothetical protein
VGRELIYNMTAPSPLRKRSLKGELYTRFSGIEERLGELIALPQNEIIARCATEDEASPKYIPSECLMYLVRANRDNTPGIYFETIYTLLLQRVMEQLPPEHDSNFTNSEIRSEALGGLAELLAGDRLAYDDRLDYYEIRFKDAVATLRQAAARKPQRIENRSAPLEANPDDPDGGEFSHKIEKAGGSLDEENFNKYFGNYDRARLAEAISTLPELQIAILEMLNNDIPIDSQDPEVFTISKALGKAEKTIRLHRSQAMMKLTQILRKEEA